MNSLSPAPEPTTVALTDAVLVVDTDPHLGRELVRHLCLDGYEAIQLSILHKPDLILLDVGMPRVNGTDAAEHLSEKLPKTHIIIVSMHSDEAYVLRALKAGAKGYLLKASPEADVQIGRASCKERV